MAGGFSIWLTFCFRLFFFQKRLEVKARQVRHQGIEFLANSLEVFGSMKPPIIQDCTSSLRPLETNSVEDRRANLNS